MNNKSKHCWRARLQSLYRNFVEFADYSRIYGLAKRLGYDCPLDAWTANPIVQGSVNPEDYRALSRPQPKTKVLFRKWKDNPKTVIAIFPEHPGTNDAGTCSSYEHVGQHGACTPTGLIARTVPAKPAEFRGLANELRQIGYHLQTISRLQQGFVATRQALIAL